MASTAESINPMDGLWSLLAYMLRKLRQQHRQSQADVGRLVAADHKTVSNWEAGRNHPPVEALRVLDLEWKAGGLLEALRHYAKTMQAPAQFLAFVEYESLADVIRMNGVAFVPGLLQTPEYAREAFTLAGEPDIEDQVRLRMERQAVLTRADPPYVSILLSEIALTVIPPTLLPGQIARLTEVAELPNVTLRLVSADVGLQVGLGGAFHIFTTPEREVGFVETPARGRLVTEVEDLRKLTVAFDRTSGRALSPEVTRTRLREIMEAHQ
ncbi:helix-turn-helix transcriptional regulator [Actinomadura sp. 6K520]|uniref:helix-turn-helix domain-containing protein n=1 Tax=Actinomadura sp. 6K520 TaxID=2530364 RepID=UPI00104EAECC|nr:helix-turn-helix transcriptional regulator [Actinomadura sp. 6K520]TDE37328.1 XRE family transcriptional regulator [Actinomadura sp. 6K520]